MTLRVKVGTFKKLVLSVLAIYLAACAGAPVVKKADEYVWPSPPERPRIKYLHSLHSEMDVGKRKSLGQRVSETIFGTRPVMVALRKPYAVFADREGKVYVADSGWKKVWVFDRALRQLYAIGEGGKGAVIDPRGIAVDSAGKAYVTDMEAKRVVIFDEKGNYLSAIGGKHVLVRPTGSALSEKLGRLYVADTWDHQVKAFSLAGQFLFGVGLKGEKPKAGEELEEVYARRLDNFWNRGSRDGEFNFPTHIAIDGEGRLYITDTMNFRVQVLDPDGNFLWKFGRPGNNPGEFARPRGIALDSEGHVYVVDAAFNNVQILNQQGRLLLNFGQFGYGEANLRLPAGIHIDSRDRVYVVDQYNHRVQVYQYLSPREGEESSVSTSERR